MRGNFDALVMATATLTDDQGQAIVSMSRQGSTPSAAIALILLDMNTMYDNQDRNWVGLVIEVRNLAAEPK